MIFQHTHEAVLAGTKTVTRRVVKPGYENVLSVRGETSRRYVACNGRVLWEVGRTYSIQLGRRQRGIARIRITGLWGAFLNGMTEEDARKEGCSSLDEFKELWDSIHSPKYHWDKNPLVNVIEFELVREAKQ